MHMSQRERERKRHQEHALALAYADWTGFLSTEDRAAGRGSKHLSLVHSLSPLLSLSLIPLTSGNALVAMAFARYCATEAAFT